MLGEQTKDDNDFDNVEPKDNKELSSDSLQNPNDPDATYRFKYDGNVGYVANVGEIFNGNNTLIKFYDFKPNIYSDQKFCEDSLNKLAEDFTAISEHKEEPTNHFNHLTEFINMFVDGTYFSFELAQKALKLGISLLPGELTGKKPSPEKVSYTAFEVDQNNQILKCPDGHTPEFTIYHEDT